MSLGRIARQTAEELRRTGRKIVFAESCTAGLVSAALSRIAGVSEWHCGGVTTYRNETKAEYLGIPRSVLVEPGPVSEPVARLMAAGVLRITPEADLSAAITGHLGPGAPPDLDGVVFLAVAHRDGAPERVTVRRIVLGEKLDRYARQRLAATALLELVCEQLEGCASAQPG